MLSISRFPATNLQCLCLLVNTLYIKGEVIYTKIRENRDVKAACMCRAAPRRRDVPSRAALNGPS